MPSLVLSKAVSKLISLCVESSQTQGLLVASIGMVVGIIQYSPSIYFSPFTTMSFSPQDFQTFFGGEGGDGWILLRYTLHTLWFHFIKLSEKFWRKTNNILESTLRFLYIASLQFQITICWMEEDNIFGSWIHVRWRLMAHPNERWIAHKGIFWLIHIETRKSP